MKFFFLVLVGGPNSQFFKKFRPFPQLVPIEGMFPLLKEQEEEENRIVRNLQIFKANEDLRQFAEFTILYPGEGFWGLFPRENSVLGYYHEKIDNRIVLPEFPQGSTCTAVLSHFYYLIQLSGSSETFIYHLNFYEETQSINFGTISGAFRLFLDSFFSF